MIHDIGFEIQTPTFNFLDFDPQKKSLFGYNIRVEKKVSPLIDVTLDNCTGISSLDKIIPEKDLVLMFNSSNILIPLHCESPSCGVYGEKCSFKDIYNDAEFHMIVNTENEKEDGIMTIIFASIIKALTHFKKEVLDSLQIYPITAHEQYISKRGRSTSKPFPFVYKKILILPKKPENIYFLSPDRHLESKNLTERVFCNIQATIGTKLRYCLEVMKSISDELLDKKEWMETIKSEDVKNLETFPKAYREIYKKAETVKSKEKEIIVAVLIYYAFLSRDNRKSFPFFIRHATYSFFQILSTTEQQVVHSLLPESARMDIFLLRLSFSKQEQNLSQSTIFKLNPLGLETKVLIEIRYLQYLISAKIGNSTDPMLNSIQSLLKLKPI